jgi:hypothetical protein
LFVRCAIVVVCGNYKPIQLPKTAPAGGSKKPQGKHILFGIILSNFVGVNLPLDHAAELFILPAL